MHSEHLQNVSWGGIVGGWLVAIAVTSLAVFAFEASGFDLGDGMATSVATVIACAVGFGAGGFFTGFRMRRAPVLHGVGIGLMSLVVGAGLNFMGSLAGWTYDPGVSAALTIGVVFVMVVAAGAGALVGYNLALRGRPGLSEDYPGDDSAG